MLEYPGLVSLQIRFMWREFFPPGPPIVPEMGSNKMRTVHLRIDLQGALMNWRDRDWQSVITENGKTLSPREVKARFLEQLQSGRRFIPCCSAEECPNFDYSEKGCPGHEVTDEKKADGN